MHRSMPTFMTSRKINQKKIEIKNFYGKVVLKTTEQYITDIDTLKHALISDCTVKVLISYIIWNNS